MATQTPRGPSRLDATDENRLDRRGLLRGVVTAGITSLAGCFGDWQIEPSATAAADDGTWHTSFYGDISEIDWRYPVGLLESFAYEVGFSRNPDNREPNFVLAEEFEEEPDRVSITLRDDIQWSNGDPLTASDLGRWVFMRRMGTSQWMPVPEIRRGNRRPRTPWEAITDIEWDDSTLTVYGEFEITGRPLSDLNTYLGRFPRSYYEGLWDAFRSAYDDDPWADEETRNEVTTIVEDNLWSVGEEFLPDEGILLEDAYEGNGVEAAFSGLWYPYRIDNDSLRFTVNETHPFADRVNFDEIVWTFSEDPNVVRNGIREGTVSGGVLNDVTEHVLEATPDHIESFSAQPYQILGLTINHRVRHLWNRDVRAALLYAIDRGRVADTTNLLTRSPISVPGADLQSERWAPESLRERLRPYDYDPDRATELLERAGFYLDGDTWMTPDDERFEIQLLTPQSTASFERIVTGELADFGIDANVLSIEGTSYRYRLQGRSFMTAYGIQSSPNAAGLQRSRATDFIKPILQGTEFHRSGFLEKQVDAAVVDTPGLRWVELDDSEHRRLEFDSIDALRAVTLKAPPLDDSSGQLRDWPYLYHAVRVESEIDTESRIEHAKKCLWIYNYQVPQVEILTKDPRIFHDTVRWDVPDENDPAWSEVQNEVHAGGLWAALARGHIRTRKKN